MTAPAASVAVVQKALGCEARSMRPLTGVGPRVTVCDMHDEDWTDRGCPVAVAAADAAVEAATPGIQAGALREAADEWQSRLKSTHPLDVEVADRIVGWLSLRADRIEAHP